MFEENDRLNGEGGIEGIVEDKTASEIEVSDSRDRVNSVLFDTRTLEKINNYINNKEFDILIRNLPSFDSKYHKEIALSLIEENKTYLLLSNIERFKGFELNNKIILKILSINIGELDYIIRNNIEGVEFNNELAVGLIEMGMHQYLFNEISIFNGLGNDVADKLMEEVEFEIFRKNIASFEGLDKKVLGYLISCGAGEEVIDNLESFEPFDLVDSTLDNLGEPENISTFKILLEKMGKEKLHDFFIKNKSFFYNNSYNSLLLIQDIVEGLE